MHGDDVASASMAIMTDVTVKGTEVFLEIMKVAIDRERKAKLNSGEKTKELSGGETTLKRLKEGGEVKMIPSFPAEDYGELLRRAKKMDIPVAAMQEKGMDKTLSVFINVKDETAINAIMQDIVREKLRQPEQTERMITIEKDQVEAFQTACAAQDIPVTFMESKDGVKCIFSAAYEKRIQAVVTDFQKMQSELSHTSVTIEQDKRGRPIIVIEDTEQGKKLSMNFCTKAKLERVLQERLGFSETKAIQTANALTASLSEQQRSYYLSSSRTLEQMEYYKPHITLPQENVLCEPYSFAKMKLPNEEQPKLTITSGAGNFVVLTGNALNRDDAELQIRQNLKVEDAEVITAILNKAERLGFVEAPRQVHYKEFQIERDSQTTFTVRGGSTEIRLNLDDKLTARKQLMDSFGISAAKADKIIAKAEKQSLTKNLLKRAKEKLSVSENTLKNKKRTRGSRT